MKNKSILTAAVLAAVTMSSASFAAPVANLTITDAVVSQTLKASGCAAAKAGGLADVVFYDDKTYTITRKDSILPPNSGTYDFVVGKTGYTLYMEPSDAARTAMFGGMETLLLANCKLKKPATTAVTLIRPSILIGKNSATVKSSNQAMTLQLVMKGRQQNDAAGTSKLGTYKATITMSGFVVGNPNP